MRYIKILKNDAILGKEEITKQDLLDVLHGSCVWLIDLKYNTFFRANKNEWTPIININI